MAVRRHGFSGHSYPPRLWQVRQPPENHVRVCSDSAPLTRNDSPGADPAATSGYTLRLRLGHDAADSRAPVAQGIEQWFPNTQTYSDL